MEEHWLPPRSPIELDIKDDWAKRRARIVGRRVRLTGCYLQIHLLEVERITRTSKNHLTYQITIEDPVVLAKPWKSAPRAWSLAQDPNDYWSEVFCTLNEEPAEIQRQKAAQPKGK
jgi:hypothetical protein